jgi:aminoglycoside/choline kinase family phosphotransferase
MAARPAPADQAVAAAAVMTPPPVAAPAMTPPVAAPAMTPPPVAAPAMMPPPAAPAFLARHGWGGATIAPLAGDASFRRYFRVIDGDRTAVLMDAPPATEDSRPFLAVGDALDAMGFSVPRPLGVDLDAGLILLDDFGDARVTPVLAAAPGRERAIYEAAIDLLADLHRHPAAGLRPYGEAELRREVRLLPDWYLPAVGLAEAPGYDAAWAATWGEVVAATAAAPVLTLRDYHADNLMLLDRPGVRGLGLLDFQDALAGHPAYDLVSLLQDARRDVPRDLEEAMIARYTAARGIADTAGFRAAYEVLGAQRNTKIIGIFTRLRDRDGRTGYVERLPRMWRLLEGNLRHPALAPVAAWFDANVPRSARAERW